MGKCAIKQSVKSCWAGEHARGQWEGRKKETRVIDTHIHSWWNQCQFIRVVLASLSITYAKEQATASSCGNQPDNCAAVVKEQSAEKLFAFACLDSWYFPDKWLPFVVLVALKNQPTSGGGSFACTPGFPSAGTGWGWKQEEEVDDHVVEVRLVW